MHWPSIELTLEGEQNGLKCLLKMNMTLITVSVGLPGNNTRTSLEM